jgi:hypothetical protein
VLPRGTEVGITESAPAAGCEAAWSETSKNTASAHLREVSGSLTAL